MEYQTELNNVTLDSSVQDNCDSCYGQGSDHQVATTQTHLKPLEAELIRRALRYNLLERRCTAQPQVMYFASILLIFSQIG